MSFLCECSLCRQAHKGKYFYKQSPHRWAACRDRSLHACLSFSLLSCGRAQPRASRALSFLSRPSTCSGDSMWAWRHAWRARPRPDMCAVFRMLARRICYVVRPRGAPALLCRQVRTIYDVRMPPQVVWALWARARPIFRPGWAQEAMGSRLDERAPAEQARWRHGRRLSSQI